MMEAAELQARSGVALFPALAPAEYFLQVVAEGFIVARQNITVTGDDTITIELRRPVDLGNGSLTITPKFAGARYAFGCNVVSLIFVPYIGCV
jgi:hypothetical protein